MKLPSGSPANKTPGNFENCRIKFEMVVKSIENS